VPICDFDILCDALLHHTDWCAQLRKQDGARDILIHQPHVLQVGSQGNKGPEEIRFLWQASAGLTILKSGKPCTVDLFPLMIECIDGACRFMDRLYRCIASGDKYQEGDLLFLRGSENDTVGCWPPILEKRLAFPLTA
jgi:hypothetical protein